MASGVRQRHIKTCARAKACKCPWGFHLELPRLNDGTRHQITKSGFASRRDAVEARASALLDARVHRSQPDLGIVTVELFMRSWLNDRETSGRLRLSTLDATRTAINNYWIPQLGQYRLAKLQARDIERALVAIRHERPDLKPSSLSRHYAVLRAALRAAYRKGLLSHDVIARVDNVPVAQRAHIRIWEPDQLRTFLNSPPVRESRLHPLFHLAAVSGLRRGELVALRWSAVDIERGYLTVTEQAVLVRGHVHLGEAKTAAGHGRRVDLDQKTLTSLRRLRSHQTRERLAWGEAWKGDDYVFTKENGAPWNPEIVSRAFKRLSRALGLPNASFHGLRHMSASLAISAGVPITVVSKRLGHSSISVTSDIYAHLLADAGRQAAEAVAGLVERNEGGGRAH